jgi:aspartyl protease family protein
MDTRVEPAYDETPVNASLILFVKMAASAGFVKSRLGSWRGVIGGLVSECGVMRNLMILAAVLVGLGTYMAQVADKMSPAPASANAAPQKAPVQTIAQASGRSLDIPRDARGHFQTDGRIEGQRVNFMIDTGASLVALNEKTAARFGLRPSRSDYNATVTTKAARTRLAMIELGGLVVRDVDALVLPDEALSENLLGLSFLSKLKRFEYANGKMVLEQ